MLFVGCINTNFGVTGLYGTNCKEMRDIDCEFSYHEDYPDFLPEMCCVCGGGHKIGTKISIII